MKKTTIVLFLFVCLAFSAESQPVITISGQITDAAAQPVPGASVHIVNTHFGATANAEGRFTIQQVPEGKYTVQVSAIGFAGILKEVTIQGSNNNLSFTLLSASRELDAILVSAQKKEEGLQRVPFSVSALNASQVTNYRLWNSRDITAIVPNLSQPFGDGLFHGWRNASAKHQGSKSQCDPRLAGKSGSMDRARPGE